MRRCMPPSTGGERLRPERRDVDLVVVGVADPFHDALACARRKPSTPRPGWLVATCGTHATSRAPDGNPLQRGRHDVCTAAWADPSVHLSPSEREGRSPGAVSSTISALTHRRIAAHKHTPDEPNEPPNKQTNKQRGAAPPQLPVTYPRLALVPPADRPTDRPEVRLRGARVAAASAAAAHCRLLLHCCNIAMLHCCNIALLRCCNIALLHCSNAALLRCCAVELLQCCTVALLRC